MIRCPPTLPNSSRAADPREFFAADSFPVHRVQRSGVEFRVPLAVAARVRMVEHSALFRQRSASALGAHGQAKAARDQASPRRCAVAVRTRIQAPKGRNAKAQGNALGNWTHGKKALKGRDGHCAPSGLKAMRLRFPGRCPGLSHLAPSELRELIAVSRIVSLGSLAESTSGNAWAPADSQALASPADTFASNWRRGTFGME